MPIRWTALNMLPILSVVQTGSSPHIFLLSCGIQQLISLYPCPVHTHKHTHPEKKKTQTSTATTSSLPFHQSNDKVDCPYRMLAGSRHYINLVKYNCEINKIIKDGLPTLKGIVTLWNISSERNLEMHLLHSCQLLIYSGFSSIFPQRNVKRSVIFF